MVNDWHPVGAVPAVHWRATRLRSSRQAPAPRPPPGPLRTLDAAAAHPQAASIGFQRGLAGELVPGQVPGRRRTGRVVRRAPASPGRAGWGPGRRSRVVRGRDPVMGERVVHGVWTHGIQLRVPHAVLFGEQEGDELRGNTRGRKRSWAATLAQQHGGCGEDRGCPVSTGADKAGTGCAQWHPWQVGSWPAPPTLSGRRGGGRPHLIQGEVWLLNLSQGVLEEVKHELLHLEPVDCPQLLMGAGRVEACERFQPVMSLAPPHNRAPWPRPSPAIPPGTRGGTAGTQEGTLGKAPAVPPPCRREGKCLAASWLAWSADNKGTLGRQSSAPSQQNCPE